MFYTLAVYDINKSAPDQIKRINAGPGWRRDRIPDPQCPVVEKSGRKRKACGWLRAAWKLLGLICRFIGEDRKTRGLVDPPENSAVALETHSKLLCPWI